MQICRYHNVGHEWAICDLTPVTKIEYLRSPAEKIAQPGLKPIGNESLNQFEFISLQQTLVNVPPQTSGKSIMS